MGATGKSAQLPLYVWLPDAMEGPTPVSALIHAATMVTAGVYVVARSHVLFTHSPTAMYVVAIVGCATAIFAATIGLVQPDIKKVLAYSTVSQLGYMFLACGVGRIWRGHFPPDDAFLLQGAAVPFRRERDSRHGRRAGYVAHGRARVQDQSDLLVHALWHHRHCRLRSLRGIFLEGRHSLRGLPIGKQRQGALWRRAAGGDLHFVLHVPAGLADVLR